MQKIFVAIAFLCLSLSVAGQQEKRLHHFNLGKNNLALSGYDPVSYFAGKEPQKGKASFSAVYDGVLYRFSSEEHKKQFLNNPAQYEPQYGGWCAFAMGKNGEKVEIDPETFEVKDGKLFLFYNKYFTNTYKSWLMDEDMLHRKADENWKRIYK